MSQQQDSSVILGSSKEAIVKGITLILIPIIKTGFDKMLEGLKKDVSDTYNNPENKNRDKMSQEEFEKLKIDMDNEKVEDLTKYCNKHQVKHAFVNDENGQTYLMYDKKDADKMNLAVSEWSREAIKNKDKKKNKERDPLEDRKKRAKEKMDKDKLKDQKRDKTKHMSR